MNLRSLQPLLSKLWTPFLGLLLIVGIAWGPAVRILAEKRTRLRSSIKVIGGLKDSSSVFH